MGSIEFGAVVDFGMIDERAAGYGAGADGNHNLGIGNGFIGLFQAEHHVPAYATGDQNAVGVARRGDELNAESSEIEDDRIEHVHVRFAGVAAGGAHFAQFQRSSEQSARFLVESCRERKSHRLSEPDLSLVACGKTIIAVCDGLPYADTCGAFPAEQASAQIDRHFDPHRGEWRLSGMHRRRVGNPQHKAIGCNCRPAAKPVRQALVRLSEKAMVRFFC